MKSKPNPFLRNLLAASLTTTLFCGNAAFATDYTWTKNSVATQDWTAAGNWDINGVFATGSGNTLAFFSDITTALADGSNSITSNVPSALTMNALTLNGKGTASGTASNITIATNSSTWTLDGSSPTVNLNGVNGTKPLNYTIAANLVLAQATTTFTGNGTAGFNFSGAISGTGKAVAKSGSSTLTLSGANSYTGGTTISGGTIKMGNATALGGNGSSFSVAGTAVLDMNGTVMTSATAYAGTISGAGSGSGALINSTTTAATYFGTLALGADATIGTTTTGTITFGDGGHAQGITGSAYNLTVNASSQVDVYGAITTASVIKTGTNTLRLESANTFAGGLYINNGAVIAKNTGSLGGTGGTGTVYLGDTGATAINTTLNLGTNGTFNNPIIVRAGNTGTATINNYGITGTPVTIAGNITMNKSLTLQSLGLSSGGIEGSAVNVSGNLINGTGTTNSLTVSGPGLTILSGTNTYNGTTTLSTNNSSGAVQFQNKVSLPGNSNLSTAAGNLSAASGTVMVFNVGGTGQFATTDIDTIATNTPTGFVSGAAIGIDTTSNSGTLSYNMATLQSGRGIGKFGSGTWSYGGTALASSAPIYIDSGTLAITSDYATAGKVGAIKFGGVYGGLNAGTLDLSAANVTATSLTVQTNNSTTSNTLTIGSGKTLAVTNMTVGIDGTSNGLTSTSALTVNGAGALTVTNQATLASITGTNSIGSVANLTFGGGASGAGSATFTGGLSLANNGRTASTNTSTATATLTIGGNGAYPFGVTSGAITMATTTGTTVAASSATASLILNAGGTLTMTGDIARGGVGTGTSTSTVTLSGGTLDMGSNNLGTTAGPISALNFQSGTLKNVLTINSTGGLTKTTAGTLSLAGSNSYTGDTTITQGVLQVGAAGAVPNGSGKGNVVFSTATNTATLDINGYDTTINGLSQSTSSTTNKVVNNASSTTKTLTVGNGDAISTFAGIIADNTGSGGTLALTKTGTGTLTLSGTSANTYTGLTTVSTGELDLNKTGVNAIGGNLTVNGGTAKLLASNQIVDTATVTVAGGILDTGAALTDTVGTFNMSSGSLNGTGTITAATYGLTGGTVTAQLGAGTINVSTGTVTLGSAGRLTGNPTLNVSSGQLTLAGAETVGAFTLSGTGTLGGSGKLLTASSYALQGGTVTANLGLGTVTVSTGTTTLNGTEAGTTVNINSGTLALGSSDRLANGATVTVAGGILDTGTALTDTVGTFNMSSGSLNGTGTVTATTYGLSGGTVTGNLGTGTMNVTGSTALNGTAGATAVNISAGTLTLGSSDRLDNTAAVNVSGTGTLAIGTNSDTVGAVTLTAGSITGSTGVLTGSSYDVQSGSVSAQLGGTGIALNKTTGGTVTLNNANTYTGVTTISGGTLALGSGGSISNSSSIIVGNAGSSGAKLDATLTSGLTIGSSQKLSGIGTVDVGSGTLTINGTHAPGNSPGVQTVTGNLNYGANSIFEWDLASSAHGSRGTDYDGVNVSGTLGGAGGATFKVILGSGSFSDTFWNVQHTWTDIFSATNASTKDLSTIFGTVKWYQGATDMTTSTGTEGYFTLNGSANTLTWTAVPEPTGALVGLLIGAGLLRRRRAS